MCVGLLVHIVSSFSGALDKSRRSFVVQKSGSRVYLKRSTQMSKSCCGNSVLIVHLVYEPAFCEALNTFSNFTKTMAR